MNNTIKKVSFTFISFITLLLFFGCGGTDSSSPSNEFLGDLPGIAKDYNSKLEAKKEAAKNSTDMDEVFKLDKEYKILKEEAEKAVKDYIVNNPTSNIPFEVKSENPFAITDVSINQKYSSTTNVLGILVKVKMNEDVSKRMSLYIKAVDAEGIQLTKKNGVIGTVMMGKNAYKKDQEVELTGGISKTADLVNFAKFIFITKEEYNKTK